MLEFDIWAFRVDLMVRTGLDLDRAIRLVNRCRYKLT
jgi:hypothetical protein